MKKYLITIFGFLLLWFVVSYFFGKGETCGFCAVSPGNLARTEYICLGKRIQKTSTYMDGGDKIGCMGLVLPIKQCYYFTEAGNSVERGACK
jgi:hypothetical protein